jgi:beta-1,4-mannosyl-glycoprotein beta-1,4-N-acetylglucosaminyltransferase
MSVIDCFPFLNELDVLEIRLQTLDPVVDTFVIAETLVSYTGQQQPSRFRENARRYGRWRRKIVSIVVEDMPGGNDLESCWRREFSLRNAIDQPLRELSPADDDTIMLSDCDEIPRPEIVALWNQSPQPRACNMSWRIGMLNTVWNRSDVPHPGRWNGTIIAQWQHYRQQTSQQWRDRRNVLPNIPNAGWHFAWQGGPEAIACKLANHCEVHANTAENTDPNRIRQCFRDRVSFITGEPTPIDNDLPSCVTDNPERWKHMLSPNWCS